MKKSICLALVFILLSPSILLCCPPDYGTPPQPSLLDASILDPASDDTEEAQDNAATDTDSEWQHYFKTFRKIDLALEEVKEMVAAASTPFQDVNDYLGFLAKCDGVNYSDNPQLYQTALQQAGNKKLDIFLRVKYAYHTVAMAVLSEKWDLGIKNYETYIAPTRVHTLIRFMAMGWAARALYKTNQTEKSVDMYLDLFDQCPSYREEAQHSIFILPGTNDVLYDLVRKLKHGRKKVNGIYLARLVGGRDYSADSLSEVVSQAPEKAHSEEIMFQMLKNIEEDHFGEDLPHLIGVEGEGQSHHPLKKIWNGFFYHHSNYEPLIPICEKTAKNSKTLHPAFWYWAACYLSLMSGDTATARKDLRAAKKISATAPALAGELEVFETLVEMAEHPDSFPGEAQKRLLDNIAQNSGLSQTLWLLAVRKFDSLKDPAKTALVVSAAPANDFFPDFHINLEKATPEDLVRLQSLLMEKGSTAPNPNAIEALALSQTPLSPKDMDLLLVYRKVTAMDYAGALADLKGLTAKDPNFLGADSPTPTPQTPNAQESNSPTPYPPTPTPQTPTAQMPSPQMPGAGGVVAVKDFTFGYDFGKVTGVDESQTLELTPFLEKMAALQATLEKAKKTDKLLEAQTAFQLGRIYITLDNTPWPDIQLGDRFRERTNPDYYAPLTPENHPGWFSSILRIFHPKKTSPEPEGPPNFSEMALCYFQEAVDTHADQELSAKSLTCMAIITFGRSDSYKTYMDALEKDYQGTEFYKRYKTTCSYFKQ